LTSASPNDKNDHDLFELELSLAESGCRMEEEPIHNPHDRFVRFMLSQRGVAAEYLSERLSPEVVQKLDLRALRSLPQSFIEISIGLAPMGSQLAATIAELANQFARGPAIA
jgi:hypothetical protein